MDGGARRGEGKPVKVTVVDRRHHAAQDGAAREEAAPVEDGGSSPATVVQERRYPSFVEELKARTEAAEKRAREAMSRAEAEIDAVRERLQRDVDRRVMEGKSGLLGSILEVADNLERAAAVAASTSPALEKGVELIRQQIFTILKAEGVEPIETVGLPYDPHLAEAVLTEPVNAGRDGFVLEEIQRGYRLGDTVLRPAKVKVGKTST